MQLQMNRSTLDIIIYMAGLITSHCPYLSFELQVWNTRHLFLHWSSISSSSTPDSSCRSSGHPRHLDLLVSGLEKVQPSPLKNVSLEKQIVKIEVSQKKVTMKSEPSWDSRLDRKRNEIWFRFITVGPISNEVIIISLNPTSLQPNEPVRIILLQIFFQNVNSYLLDGLTLQWRMFVLSCPYA